MATSRKTGGRKPGSRNKVTRAIRERIAAGPDPVSVLQEIMEGTVPEGAQVPTTTERLQAARALMDKIVPAAKTRPVEIPVPEVTDGASLLLAHNQVMQAMAAGRITPDEAQTIGAVLTAHRGIIETADLEARIAALEGKAP